MYEAVISIKIFLIRTMFVLTLQVFKQNLKNIGSCRRTTAMFPKMVTPVLISAFRACSHAPADESQQ